MSPEFQLLCALLPVHFRGEMPWPESWGTVDPAGFYSFVLKTQVAPHAFHAWERTPSLWETTPFEIRARIVGWQEIFRNRQKARFQNWKQLLAAFDAAGLPVIPLKGFALSQYLYDDPFRRLSCDIDILVCSEDLPRLNELLAKLGFVRDKWLGTRLASETTWFGEASESRESTLVDIHWDFTPPWYFLRVPLDAVWDEAAEAETAGVRHRALGPAGMALFSLVNNTTDYGLGNLRGCVETLELLARLEGAAADRFAGWARTARARRALAALEIFRSRLFPGSPPDLVTRFHPAKRLLLASRFDRWDYYLHDGEPSKWRQAGVRFTLAGPTPRFLRFLAGKVLETLTRLNVEAFQRSNIPTSQRPNVLTFQRSNVPTLNRSNAPTEK